jgi:hypothetical protein
VYSLRKLDVPRDTETQVAQALQSARDDSHYWVRQAAEETLVALRLGD